MREAAVPWTQVLRAMPRPGLELGSGGPGRLPALPPSPLSSCCHHPTPPRLNYKVMGYGLPSSPEKGKHGYVASCSAETGR